MKRRDVSTNSTTQRPSLRRTTRSHVSVNAITQNEAIRPIKTLTSTVTLSVKTKSLKLRSVGKGVHENVIDVEEYEKEKTDNSIEEEPKTRSERKTKFATPPGLPEIVTTPKSNKSYSHHGNSDGTPFKDDFFSCSQTDSQSDVNWDCTSPDALRILKKGRRRHRHPSDVTDIVNQLLVVPEENEQNEVTSTASTPPLLGLWMKSSRADVQLQRTSKLAPRVTRSKRRDKLQLGGAKKGSLQQDLVDKLMAVKHNEDESDEKSTKRNMGDPEGPAQKVDGAALNFSKDLFESTQPIDNKATSEKDSACQEIDTQSDASWSDDDIFNDESFIMKATQEPVTSGKETGTRCKRKSENESTEVPLSKGGKFSIKQTNVLQTNKGVDNLLHRSTTQVVNIKPPGTSAVTSQQLKHSKPTNTQSQVSTNTATKTHNNLNLVGSAANGRFSVQQKEQSYAQSAKSAASYSAKSAQQNNQMPKPQKSLSNASKSPPLSASVSSSKPKTGNYVPYVQSGSVQGVTQSCAKEPAGPTVKPAKIKPHGINVSPAQSVRRRSSGVFDTSLTDDFLCQLAEPDEILESQVEPVGKASNFRDTKTSLKQNDLTKKPSYSLVKSENVLNKNNVSNRSKTYNSISTQSAGANLSCKNAVHSNSKRNVNMSFVKTDTISNKTQSSQYIKAKQNTGLNPQSGKTVIQSNASVLKQPDNNLSSSTKSLQSVSSSQQKYSFKSVSPKNQGTSTSTSKSVAGIPAGCQNLAKKCETVATKDPQKKASLYQDSEDLFESDEEDALSELQILAMLDTVEMEATQNIKEPSVQSKKSCEAAPIPPAGKCSMDEIERKRQAALERRQKKNLEKSQFLPCSQSPIKCSPEEIDHKKQEAVERRNRHRSSSASSNSSISPGKCTPDEIERKKLTALEKLKKSSPNSNCSISPLKCSQEEIDGKRKRAMEKRQKLDFDRVNISPQKSDVHEQNQRVVNSPNSDSLSPFKCTPDEIEKKKQAALQRRQEALKKKGNLSSKFF